MSYARLSKRPSLFKSFTGLDISEFDTISTEMNRYQEHERKRLFKRRRHRDVGAGRPFKLKVKERFFLILLVYYRLYITYTLSEFLFDLNQSNVYRDISILEPLVKRCIPLPEKLYKHTRRRLRTIDEVEEFFPCFRAFIDATEQGIPRPKKQKEEEKFVIVGNEKQLPPIKHFNIGEDKQETDEDTDRVLLSASLLSDK